MPCGPGVRERRRSTFSALAALALGLTLSGCANKPSELVAVKGKVLYNGQPAALLVVKFWPKDSKQRAPEVVSGADGTFSLKCLPGNYKVTVTALPKQTVAPALERGQPAPSPTPEPAESSPSFPDKYTDPVQTPLKVEIPDNGKDSVVLRVQDDPPEGQ